MYTLDFLHLTRQTNVIQFNYIVYRFFTYLSTVFIKYLTYIFEISIKYNGSASYKG